MIVSRPAMKRCHAMGRRVATGCPATRGADIELRLFGLLDGFEQILRSWRLGRELAPQRTHALAECLAVAVLDRDAERLQLRDGVALDLRGAIEMLVGGDLHGLKQAIALRGGQTLDRAV